ncbi:hypothetical protein FOA43_001004 [Brettanomyces nanus]|uniref:RNA helicase n=1 Tax=Eeniella nana TaxID=13502 RepID=A0A875RWL8_EENNA|nr:uncharacterized protein FOA43_001004 [Brettanomyces nanus]QPG73691.1 hypothetical protein FOA43_001004 [Brettanomyces nanus]
MNPSRAEETKTPETNNNFGNSMMVKTDSNQSNNDKALSRRQKLEAWKTKKNAQKHSKTSASKMTFKAHSLTRRVKLGSKKLKRSLIDDITDDEDEHNGEGIGKKVKKVKIALPNEHDEPDDLDYILAQLQKVTKQSSENRAEMLNENDAVDYKDQKREDQSADAANSLLTELADRDKKEIPDHPVSTRIIEKNFYKESSFISELTEEEVSSLRLRDGVIVRGNSASRPVLAWSQLGLPSSISSVLDSFKFDSPTPIQSEALPDIMKGLDFIGIAKTGSGKTLAYLIPMFRQLVANRLTETGRHINIISQPMALILTPTRELAIQIFRICRPFFVSLHLRGACCYGGQPISQQIALLKKQTDVLVCTPGRLIDLLRANSGRILSLSDVSYLVLDEADRMFDLGFEPQVTKLESALRPDRQTVLFSATFPPKIEHLARKVLHKPVEVSVGTRNLLSSEISQKFAVIALEEKFTRLLQILGEFKSSDPNGKVLIFADTQKNCDSLVRLLTTRGYPSLCLHGGREQADRDNIVKTFRDGLVDTLVATSIASRGLDIAGLNLVINYDSPTHMEDYVHRVGRTGRAGKKGASYTFITPTEEKSASDIVRLLELSSMEVPSELKKMATSFREKVSNGKAHFSGGFGGKGLEKLAEVREERKKIQEAIYKANDDDGNGSGADGDKEENKSKNDSLKMNSASETAPELKIEFFDYPMDEFSAPFHATVGINDLPPEVRRDATRAYNLAKIIEQTSVSITGKGQYYAPGKHPGESDAPKLYLLLEGYSKPKIQEAAKMIKDVLVEHLMRAKDKK